MGLSAINQAADVQSASSLSNRLRRQRFAFFESLFPVLASGRPVTILDIGGTANYWSKMGYAGHAQIKITLVNVEAEPSGFANIVSLAGDARDLSRFADHSFDIVYSNSVIEHVGNQADQARMAAEMRRIGKAFFLQTPNFWFPIEPHFLFPGFQFLPLSAKAWLLRHFDLGWHRKVADRVAAEQDASSIRLLSKNELARLFPGAEMRGERFYGLVKSWMVYST